MTDSKSSLQPASSVAAPALRKRFYEAHRFLSRVAQFPLVMGKLYRDGLDHPTFFAALCELLPLERMAFCLPQQGSELCHVWVWDDKKPLAQDIAPLSSWLRSFEDKPLRINECQQEMDEELFEGGLPLWGGLTRSVMSIPLHFQGQALGVLFFCASQAARFNDGEFAHAQTIADALTPLAAYRLLQETRVEAQQAKLQTLELERNQHEEELQRLREQLEMSEDARYQAMEELEMAREKLESLESQNFQTQKQVHARRNEIERLGAQLQFYREERVNLQKLCEGFDQSAQMAMQKGEQLRQHLIHVHRSASMMRQLADQRLKDSVSASQSQTELMLDASSNMIPEALNSLNHLSSLQDPAFGQLNSRQQRFVRFSLRSTRYISQLLSELNDYNRCIQGSLQLQPESLQLTSMFQEVRAKFHTHTKQKRLKVEWSCEEGFEDLDAVVGDPYVCRQLLYVMLEHAVDATPVSGNIHFHLQPDMEDLDQLMITVLHDSELELLSADDLEQLFLPFKRSDFDPDDDIPPGLSLALARELTLLHQGEIDVETRDEQLYFRIFLPRRLEGDLEPPSRSGHQPLIEMPPLPEEWRAPFHQSLPFPEVPVFVPSSDILPSSRASSAQLMSAGSSAHLTPPGSSAHLTAPGSSAQLTAPSSPPPPRSLSSPSLQALPNLPPQAFSAPSRDPNDEVDAFLPTESLSLDGGFEEEELIEVDSSDVLYSSVTDAEPLDGPSDLDFRSFGIDDDDESDPTMIAPPNPDGPSLRPTPPPGASVLFDDPEELALEAELDLEDHSPTQMFKAEDIGRPHVYEIDSMDGEGFLLEEIEEVEVSDDDDFMLEDLEAEPEFLTPSGTLQRVSALPHMLYLTDSAGAPLPSLFTLLETWGYRFSEANSDEDFFAKLRNQSPSVLALISTDPDKSMLPVLEELQRPLAELQLPLLLVHQYPNEETRLQLHWKNQRSEPLRESFWMGWLDRIRHPQAGKARELLAIGLDMEQAESSALIEFFCGDDYALQLENNPALGVQLLYQSPPDLLMIQLDQPLEHWGPLFEEVGRSARTREIPIVILSEINPTKVLSQALRPLHFLYLHER